MATSRLQAMKEVAELRDFRRRITPLLQTEAQNEEERNLMGQVVAAHADAAAACRRAEEAEHKLQVWWGFPI